MHALAIVRRHDVHVPPSPTQRRLAHGAHMHCCFPLHDWHTRAHACVHPRSHSCSCAATLLRITRVVATASPHLSTLRRPSSVSASHRCMARSWSDRSRSCAAWRSAASAASIAHPISLSIAPSVSCASLPSRITSHRPASIAMTSRCASPIAAVTLPAMRCCWLPPLSAAAVAAWLSGNTPASTRCSAAHPSSVTSRPAPMSVTAFCACRTRTRHGHVHCAIGASIVGFTSGFGTARTMRCICCAILAT